MRAAHIPVGLLDKVKKPLKVRVVQLEPLSAHTRMTQSFMDKGLDLRGDWGSYSGDEPELVRASALKRAEAPLEVCCAPNLQVLQVRCLNHVHKREAMNPSLAIK